MKTTAEIVAFTVILVAFIAFMAYAVHASTKTPASRPPPDLIKSPAVPMWTTKKTPAPTAEIWISRRRMGGAPCIYGTRIPTDTIAAWRDDPEGACEAYPGITVDDVMAAVWWESQS